MDPTGTAPVDFGRAAGDYARHRAGFPRSFFERLAADGLAAPGTRALDLGTGTGTIARGLTSLGLRGAGLDISRDLLVAGRALDAEGGPSGHRVVARAERAPFASGTFDLVVAGQCWHWFDGPAVAAECRRLLRPGGALVVAHFDYLAVPGNPAGATEELVLARNPGWPMAWSDGRYPRWRPHLEGAGFRDLRETEWDEAVTYSHAAWRGRIRACNGVIALHDPARIASFDAEHAALLEASFPDPMVVPHRVWFLAARA